MFRKKKNKDSSSVVWRNSSGKIACPGDNCPRKCDETCPIWLNTIGLGLSQKDNYEKALLEFDKAAKIAPDFSDAYNNMAACFGSLGMHEQAKNAYTKAHELDPNKKGAIIGLAVAHKNLGLYQNALTFCDEYEKKFSAENIKSIRKEIESLKNGQSVQLASAVEIASEILDFGREHGYITSAPKAFPMIPELISRAGEVCDKIIENHRDYCNNNPKANLIQLSLTWSVYAGVGAVWHWHVNWPDLQKNGIFETLAKARGIDEMDEYVMDAVGLKFGSPEEKEFSNFIPQFGIKAYEYTAKFKGDNAKINQQFNECMKAMFFYGMVYEMNRLGMK